MLTKRWKLRSLQLLDQRGTNIKLFLCQAFHVLFGIHDFRLYHTFSCNIALVCEYYVSMVLFGTFYFLVYWGIILIFNLQIHVLVLCWVVPVILT